MMMRPIGNMAENAQRMNLLILARYLQSQKNQQCSSPEICVPANLHNGMVKSTVSLVFSVLTVSRS